MPGATPSISVIMPVYNAGPYLRRALDSVCNQSFRDLEILCVNDGSTDESPAILAEYAARDARIRVLDHGENRGYACAMNSGFDAACGEAVGIVDSDDAISKNFFAELWKVYEKEGCDIAKGRRVDCEQDGRWHEGELNASIQKDALAFSYQWTTAIYRTSLLGRHGLRLAPEVPSGQDTLFLMQLMGHEPPIAFSDQAIYYYFRNPASMTKAHPEEYYLGCNLKIASLLKKYLPAYPGISQRRKMFRRLIDFLNISLNDRFAHCDCAPYLTEIQAILADDEFYAPQASFPFLRKALEATSIREVKAALKASSGHLVASSLRESLRAKPPCPAQ